MLSHISRLISLRGAGTVAMCVSLSFTSSCALQTPDLRLPINGGAIKEGMSEHNLVLYVRCALGQALYDAVSDNDADRAKYGNLAPHSPSKWLQNGVHRLR